MCIVAIVLVAVRSNDLLLSRSTSDKYNKLHRHAIINDVIYIVLILCVYIIYTHSIAALAKNAIVGIC